jgi:HmuY protein
MSHERSFTILLACCLSIAAGCADSLQERLKPEADAGAAGAEPGSRAVGEVVTLVIDASSQEDTIYLDLDRGRKVGASAGWDLSFRRFHVQMNGGVSGEGGVQALALESVAFEDVESAPEDGFSSDVQDGEADDDTDPDNVFNNGESDWYVYDVGDHTLTSKQLVYVVSSTEQQLFKFAIDDYYDQAGSPAILSVRWARLSGPAPEPAPSETLDDAGADAADSGASASDAGADAVEPATPTIKLTVEAGSSSDWVYVSLSGEIVTTADPETSLDWDLAFKRTELRTNSGASGPGQGGAKLVEGEIDFHQISEMDTSGFSIDEPFNSGAPGATEVSQNAVLGDWYDYNPMTHAVSPSALSFIVRSASGEHFKLRILSWRDGVFEIEVGPIGQATSE